MSGNANPPRLIDIAVDGEHLRVARREGAGTPLVVCNDFAANLEVLDDFVAALERPTLCFDAPGIGGSLPVRRLRRMRGLARLLAAVLDALETRAPVDLLGLGWGGLLAQRFVYDHPERARRLILAATSGGALMFPGRFANLRRLASPASLTRVAPDARAARSVFGGRREDECEAVSRALVRARAPTSRGYSAQLFAASGFTSLPWLHRLQLPALILAGDDDPLVPTANARTLALLMPRARLKILRGAGHWLALERTGEVVRLVEDFLDAPRAISPVGRETPL